MIIEIAYLTIEPSRASDFEQAVAEAAPYFKAAQGCHGMRLERVEEDPALYRLSVDWRSIEDHMVAFRQSEGFQKWRSLAGPFFTQAPRVEHWKRVGEFF